MIHGRTLYVGRLPPEASEADLRELFAPFGPVSAIRIIRDVSTGRPYGFAFVEMATEDAATRAAAALQDGAGAADLTVSRMRREPE